LPSSAGRGPEILAEVRADEHGRPLSVESASSRLLVPTVFAMYATAVANTTSGAVAQPAVGEAFSASPADVGWIVFGYSGAFAIMTAVYGSLARRFGLVPCLTTGVLLLAAGAAVAVFATSLPMLIVARVVQGLGAGAVPTLSMALIGRKLSGPARARALGVGTAAVGLGFAGGPLVGGLLLEWFGWRGAMALGLLVAPAAAIVWRLDRDRGTSQTSVDLRGILLLAGTVGSLVFLINRLPVLGLTPVVVAAGVALVALGIVYIRYSGRRSDAVVPLDLLGHSQLRRLMGIGFIGQTAFLGTIVIVPIAAARVHGLDGFVLGLLLVPMALAIALLSPRNGWLQERIGRPATTRFAVSAVGIASALLGLAGADAPPVVLAGGLLVGGVGFSFLNPPLVNEVTRIFPGPERSVALGVYNLVFFLGSASGAAIATGLVAAPLVLPPLITAPLPGFSTALLLLAVPALLAAPVHWLGSRRATWTR